MNIRDVSLTFDLCHSKRKSSIIYHVLDMVFDILFKWIYIKQRTFLTTTFYKIYSLPFIIYLANKQIVKPNTMVKRL